MSSDWDEVVLSDAIEIIGGGTPKTSVDEYWNGDIPWLSVVDFNDSGRFVFDTEKSITKDGLNNSSTKILDEGDIIISARGTVGALAQLGKPMAFNQSCYGIKGKQDQTVNDFLYYLLVNTVNNLKRIAHGGVFDTITRSTFDNITVRIPRIAKQIQIASILGSLDKKIHLNQQTNETLEAMAQAIFKSWFVDFDPVRAKIEAKSAGRDPNRAAMAAIAGIPLEQDWDEIEAALDQKLTRMSEAQQEQLSRTAELFPDELVESEIGEVPKGWEMNGFNKIADMDNSSVSPSDHPEKIWKHHSFPAFDETELPIEEKGKEIKSRKYLIQKNAVLVSKLNPRFERTWAPKVDDSESNICSTEFMPFVPREENGRGFVYYLVRSLPFQQGIKQRVTGSTGSRQRAKPKQVAKMEVIIPNSDIRNAFSKISNNVLLKIQNNIHENKQLADLRDTLLPKLISGELELN